LKFNFYLAVLRIVFATLHNPMKRAFLLFVFITGVLAPPLRAQPSGWQPVAGRITTTWAAEVNPASPLPEYPRPQLVRDNWLNLNGLWEYALLPKAQADNLPTAFAGNILVPYAVESALSGVGKTVGKDSLLWYHRTVNVPAKLRKGRLLLHFGAVDWETELYVNGRKAGSHRGGYDPFSFDITPHLKAGAGQEIVLRVWDPTSDGPQPRGKQVKNPHSIWYTPVTGIWQTVWLESVPDSYLSATRHTPDIDKGTLTVTAQVQNGRPATSSA
jgi:hypothetical protein